jgi:hypothetical protein
MPNPSRVTTITDSAQHLQQPSGLFQLVTPTAERLGERGERREQAIGVGVIVDIAQRRETLT